ncbi:MAG TPA: hypothetical protein VHN16_04025 [Streptosporangiaceae bacterium]|jgi:hypothetical protein|nr:hypothetical protein [Streptosporangiaceae bacterium]
MTARRARRGAVDTDWVSDEAGSHQLYWTEPRVIAGSDPVPMGSNNSGRGVGGSMVHYAGYTPRFHPSDPDGWSVLKEGLMTKAREILPGKNT